MEIEFDKEYLSEFYYVGKATDKKHRFQPQIIKRYVRCFDLPESIASAESLYPDNSLNYEVLSGDK